jgi:hypothetical protein
VVAAVLALLISGGGQAQADSVRFQNVRDVGPEPFTEPAESTSEGGNASAGDGAGAGSGSGGGEGASPDEGQSEPETDTEPPDDGQTTDEGGGDEPEPGTFGGTGKNRACDREKLIRELTADPEKLREWAEVVGIEADERKVAEYVRELRPVELTQDTQVTNHRYSGGGAEPYQAILEKGTAVLVDKDGKPVTRCRCGNPLAEPVELEQEVQCIDCPPNYQPPPPCDYYDYPDGEYDRYGDREFERQYRPDDYKGKCYRPEPEPPPVEEKDEPHDDKPTPEECKSDPNASGCEQQCEQSPELPHCQPEEETPQEEEPSTEEPPTEGEQAPPEDEESAPEGGETTPEGGGGTSPEGGGDSY